jgi:hypothetical protein
MIDIYLIDGKRVALCSTHYEELLRKGATIRLPLFKLTGGVPPCAYCSKVL